MTTETQSAADVGFIRKIRGLMAKTTEAGCTEGSAARASGGSDMHDYGYRQPAPGPVDWALRIAATVALLSVIWGGWL